MEQVNTRAPVTDEAKQSGATLRELMNRMGHSTTRAALIYPHTGNGRDQMIADAWESSPKPLPAPLVIADKSPVRLPWCFCGWYVAVRGVERHDRRVRRAEWRFFPPVEAPDRCLVPPPRYPTDTLTFQPGTLRQSCSDTWTVTRGSMSSYAFVSNR